MKKARGPVGLRASVGLAMYHMEQLQKALGVVKKRSVEVGATDQLALAIKALRSIANSTGADGRSAGIARGALRRLGVEP